MLPSDKALMGRGAGVENSTAVSLEAKLLPMAAFVPDLSGDV
jgi:hypothetical protein